MPDAEEPSATRRRRAALAGHEGDLATARALLDDPDGEVRATALGAVARLGAATGADVGRALRDAAPTVRRRACEVAVTLGKGDVRLLLDDADASVVETAAWALGERGEATDPVVDSLARTATDHADPLCREAAVAALGALGNERGLSAILAAAGDKPAVRRRAVIALAPFDGPEVEAALRRALSDRDRQVRQAAEDLLNP